MLNPRTLGFVGTLRPLNVSRALSFRMAVEHFKPSEFHFGDELGSDGSAHLELRKSCPSCRIHAHPSTREWARAWRHADVRHRPLDPISRWKAIVHASDIVIVAPETDHFQPRSFTWPAVLFALRKHKEVYVITTNGRAKRYRLASDRQAEGFGFAFPA